MPAPSPSRGELPIIQATMNLIQWFVPLLNRLPRDHRFALGDRLVHGLHDLLEGLVAARYATARLERPPRPWLHAPVAEGVTVQKGPSLTQSGDITAPASGRTRLAALLNSCQPPFLAIAFPVFLAWMLIDRAGLPVWGRLDPAAQRLRTQQRRGGGGIRPVRLRWARGERRARA
jgi:hypothetical protein